MGSPILLPRLIKYAGNRDYTIVAEGMHRARMRWGCSEVGGEGWLVPEFTHMTFLPMIGVVVWVKHGLVVVDIACAVGECLRQC